MTNTPSTDCDNTRLENLSDHVSEHFEAFILLGFDMETGDRILLLNAKTQMHESAIIELLRDAVEEIRPALVGIVEENSGESGI